MSSIEWKRLNDEITQLYVTEDRSAEDTIRTLNQRHKLRITIKQFKRRYSGMKKLRANEWRAIKREMRKQKAAGKECLVFLNGRQLAPERVVREMRRYSGIRGQDVEDGSVPLDIGIDTTDQHRVELRTKGLSESDISAGVGSSVARLCFSSDATCVIKSHGTNSANIDSLQETFLDMDGNDLDMSALLENESPDLQTVQTMLCTRSDQAGVHGNSGNTTSAMTQRPFPTPEFFMPGYGFPNPSMVPKFRFKIPARFSKMLRSMAGDIPQVNHIMKYYLKGEIKSRASNVNQLRWLARLETRNPYSGWTALASGDTSLRLMKPIYSIAEDVLSGEGGDGSYLENADAKNCHIAMCKDQCLLNLFFAVVLHLICNNIAGVCAIPSLLEWATEMNVLDQLATYLKINPGDPDAFLEAAIRCLQLGLDNCTPLSRSHSSQSSWWEQLIELFDNKGLGFSKRLSSLLLHAIADTTSVSSARILLANGADVNVTAPITHDHRRFRAHQSSDISLGPPLFQAIYSTQYDMAKVLIEAGSEIDRCYNGSSPEVSCNALSISFSESNPKFAEILLEKGAQMPPSIKVDLWPMRRLLESTWKFYPCPLLRQWILDHLPLIDLVVKAAGISSTELSKVLLAHNILQEAALECALRRAVKAGNVLAVQTLLQRGVDPNPPPCQIECSKRLGIDEELVAVAPICLIDKGINEDERLDIMVLLLRAGSDMPDQILDYLLFELGGNSTILYPLLVPRILATPILGASALENAVDWGLSHCSLLLDHGAPLNYHGRGGMSCLQRAAGKNNLLLTRFLLENGADANFAAHEDGGRTALQSAVERGATPVVEFLLSVGANIKAAPAKRNGVTLLEALAKSSFFNLDLSSKLDQFRNWVAKGAPINRPDGDDGKLLHYFVRYFDHACLEEALVLGAKTDARCHEVQDEEAMADINAPPSGAYGRTALQEATCNTSGRCGHEMMQLLLSFGADVNAPPVREGGITALQGAAISGDLGAAKMLLERGADINAPAAAENGRTAIEGAAEHGRLDMVQFLLDNGAKGEHETGFSKAIDLAEAEVHFRIAKVLRAHVETPAYPDLAYGESSDRIAIGPPPDFVISDETLYHFDFGFME
ncbi:hypothetical protein BDP55DRAFT_637418 [Colletotrichum godetiae]|uniref:Clr5 domain-containing protein n=1 Tax=Colletotrichum godetiae TaxID=1209918 RepID=A0AAJ0AC57_9PEZI|nr:uncharacterized protein BDP55DRAFT_637418 [Colletotrichum godetiae]KAK1658912.1 hypothetical protein BDP55DRAFT_637418 [Colletotrichum godetiae]